MNQFFYLITALTDFHYFNFVNNDLVYDDGIIKKNIDEINFLQDLVYNDGNGIIKKKKKKIVDEINFSIVLYRIINVQFG